MRKKPSAAGLLSVTPVARYPRPQYPDLNSVLSHPSLLANVPGRWHQKPAVCVALFATLALGLSSCSVPPSGPLTGTGPLPEAPDNASIPSPQPVTKALTIPVFPHGEGMGSYGCVSVAPPVFLSEEEAAQIIREEASRYGIQFDADKTEASPKLPYTDLNAGFGEEAPRNRTYSGSIDLDGYDEKAGVGFEFVSVEDIRQWQDPERGAMVSVDSYDTKGTAERLSKELSNVAVFYDPMESDYSAFRFEFDWETAGKTDEERNAAYSKAYQEETARYDAQERSKSIEALKKQVQDFLEWLKGQGVI